jgi:hypothetical protein
MPPDIGDDVADAGRYATAQHRRVGEVGFGGHEAIALMDRRHDPAIEFGRQRTRQDHSWDDLGKHYILIVTQQSLVKR